MMTTIQIQDNICWVCGKGKDNKPHQQHHALPLHLKPKNNIVVPVCDRCHKKINSNDVIGMFAYLVKLEQLACQVRIGVSKLSKMVTDKQNVPKTILPKVQNNIKSI